MFHVLMFLAFCGTRVTYSSADAADFRGEAASPAHVTRCGPANCGAIFIQPNTLHHHLDILLAEAGVAAVFTFLRTSYARFDTGSVLFVRHRDLPSQVRATPLSWLCGRFPFARTIIQLRRRERDVPLSVELCRSLVGSPKMTLY